jgi:drug/metabolite transporter (DMT)-like permease
VEIALALTSAFLFALGSVLQQKAGLDGPAAGSSSGLLLRMARRPVWIGGIACDGLGFVAQAAALGIGSLAVVQPLLVTSVVFALPLGVWLTGQRVRRAEVVAAAVVVVALAVFLIVANPSGGKNEAPLSDWLLAAGVCGVICAPLVLLGRTGPPRHRAALLGTAAGILFALSAALTKAVVDELSVGIVHLLTSWEPYALIAIGYISMTLNQMALDTGALAAAIATSASFDPIVSVVLGLTLFDEALDVNAAQATVTLIALTLALAGMMVLARKQVQSPTPVQKPTPVGSEAG